MGGILVLPGLDQQRYLGDPHAPEEVHRMAFVGNIVEQVNPIKSSLRRMLTNNKSPQETVPPTAALYSIRQFWRTSPIAPVRQLP
jgi:hypothetical protein